MTREEANKELERAFDVLDHTCHMDNRRKEAFNMARVALSAEPCEDAISREEVCDYIAEFVNHEYATDRERELVKHIIGGIQHLPSIQPTAKENLVVEDCISRKQAMKACYQMAVRTGIEEMPYKYAETELAHLPSIQPKTEWIPVSERLPKYGEKVLCWTTYNAFEVGYRDNEWGQDVWTTGKFASGTFRVVAWMPLPKPYTAESEGKE